MDPVADKDLLWIAREGFAAPVPEPWTQCKNEDGEIYFVNTETNRATWGHPLDEKYMNIYREEKKKRSLAISPFTLEGVNEVKKELELADEFEAERGDLSLIHICRCRRPLTCRSRWSPYH
eukprot:TRINITY_DN21658_c0_g1_i1.p1 TRINITY_DN21658_c0_g1~~TRINITY_DN21658_c0_g1_i1.p1  ORF type:complete len:121 (-),score=30.68 TRINITY_DN21658_c0_g1_i1:9-371(-)